MVHPLDSYILILIRGCRGDPSRCCLRMNICFPQQCTCIDQTPTIRGPMSGGYLET